MINRFAMIMISSDICSCYLIMIILCLLLVVPNTTALAFNLEKIGPECNDVLLSYGNAGVSTRGIEITPSNTHWEGKAGRVVYSEPLHLWDKVSGFHADFITDFSFVIDSNGSSNFSDGFTFFLADEVGTVMVAGGAMGLPIDLATLESYSSFVAVEFDTLRNYWDPVNAIPDTHVGVNVNSIKSKSTAVWYSEVKHGMQYDVSVSYDSTLKVLSLVYSGFINNTKSVDVLHFDIDLAAYLKEHVFVGFSASTGSYFERHIVNSWKFMSTSPVDNGHEDADPPITQKPDIISPVPSSPENKTSTDDTNPLLLELSLFAVVVVGLAVVGLGFTLWKKNISSDVAHVDFDPSMDREFKTCSGPKKFSYCELSRATNNFSEDWKLGEGGFGTVYKGFLKESKSYIAVKRISSWSKQGIKSYASEVTIISQLRHRNLVQLIGWCHENKELLLVYEFMPNGSLDAHLFQENDGFLTWLTRYNIARGLASALWYLHEEWEQCVLHRDIKPSNIMLDSNFNPKLGDFGLARFVDHVKGSRTTVLAGTMGYLAPECLIMGKASKESDVYSFGVVALEIACGRKPFDPSAKEGEIRLVDWIWKLYGEGKLLDAIDKKLGNDFSAKQLNCLLTIGIWCAHPDLNLRPSMRQVNQFLNFEASLPSLISVIPAPAYSGFPVHMRAFSLTSSYPLITS